MCIEGMKKKLENISALTLKLFVAYFRKVAA